MAFMVTKKRSIFPQNLSLVTRRKLETWTVQFQVVKVVPWFLLDIMAFYHQQTCWAVPFNLTPLTMFI